MLLYLNLVTTNNEDFTQLKRSFNAASTRFLKLESRLRHTGSVYVAPKRRQRLR